VLARPTALIIRIELKCMARDQAGRKLGLEIVLADAGICHSADAITELLPILHGTLWGHSGDVLVILSDLDILDAFPNEEAVGARRR
jgi:hypothetical protein